jgi:tRNA A37 threonylcarbamoyladenosine synthetase subunit TsaC/SUA5/YrdC
VGLGIKARYLKSVEQYWPNPISIEIPHGLTYLNQATGRQAFRIPKDEAVRALLEETGPLLTSSANHPGEPNATTLKEAQDYFGDEIDFYVEGGNLSDRAPSTVMRVVDDMVEVVREGAVKINEAGEIIS